MAAVAIRDLTILYDSKGKKRVNRSDEQGNLYLFYQDKKEKVIIRDLLEQDAQPLVKAIRRCNLLTPKQAKLVEEEFKKEVRKRKEDDLAYRLLLTNVSGKILGTIKVSPLEGENEGSEAQVLIELRDQNAIDTMAEAVIRAVQNLHKNYKWYDRVALKRLDGELEEL